MLSQGRNNDLIKGKVGKVGKVALEKVFSEKKSCSMSYALDRKCFISMMPYLMQWYTESSV